MTRFLLDTNIPVYLENTASPFHNPVKEHFQRLKDDDLLFMSVYKEQFKTNEFNKETIKKNDVDFILSGAAIANGLIIVSNDRIFPRIKQIFPQLQVANWTENP